MSSRQVGHSISKPSICIRTNENAFAFGTLQLIYSSQMNNLDPIDQIPQMTTNFKMTPTTKKTTTIVIKLINRSHTNQN